MPHHLNLPAATLPIIALLATALPVAAFEGTYRNNQTTTLKVTKRGAGYHAAVDLRWRGCLGSIDGPATVKRNVMTMRARDPDSREACIVRITFKGRTATLDEQSGCLIHHGAACAFVGTVRR
jgi:hypothetical protein